MKPFATVDSLTPNTGEESGLGSDGDCKILHLDTLSGGYENKRTDFSPCSASSRNEDYAKALLFSLDRSVFPSFGLIAQRSNHKCNHLALRERSCWSKYSRDDSYDCE